MSGTSIPATGNVLISGPMVSAAAPVSRWIGPHWGAACVGAAWKPFGGNSTVSSRRLADFPRPSGRARGFVGRPASTTPNRMHLLWRQVASSPARLRPARLNAVCHQHVRGLPHFSLRLPTPADFTGTILAQNTNFKQGRSSAVQHQCPAGSCPPRSLSDRGLRGLAQLAHSGGVRK